MDSPTVGVRSLYTSARNVGFRHDLPQPECMVQCSGGGPKEGLRPTVLYRFLPSQCPHEERLLPTAKDPGGAGEFGRYWSFFMLRPKAWILANQDGRVIKTVHCTYCW